MTNGNMSPSGMAFAAWYFAMAARSNCSPSRNSRSPAIFRSLCGSFDDFLESPDFVVSRIFLLSPAKSRGRRAQLLTRPHASFELARQLQIGDATLADVFAFCSGLYFRGKLTYARRFAQPPAGAPGVLVITPSRGLVPPESRVGLDDLEEFAAVNVDATEPRFTISLQESAKAITDYVDEVVLLGSIATGKYVDALLPLFGKRLLFPGEFVGRGDMSRGGLLLRCAALGDELSYIPVAGAIRKGRRPARLVAVKMIRTTASSRLKERQ
jgi:hypothetical protein